MVDDTAKARPTLAVIAREAGVSVPTVSRVINGREDVAAVTRAKVTAVLERRGYVRSRGTVLSRKISGKPIDVVMHSINSSYAATLLSGIEHRAHEAGLDIVVSAVENRNPTAHPVRGWLDRVATRGTAGVLLVLAHPTAVQRGWLEHYGVPFVLVDPIRQPSADMLSVGATNWAGGYSAAEHLIALGHRRLGVIATPRTRLYSMSRVEGFRAAVEAAGLELPTDYVRHVAIHQPGGHAGMAQLLDLPAPPTAVFCCTDPMAIGAYTLLSERGMAVPDDMSIVGFDDSPECSWIRPRLTSVGQPLTQMGGAAFDLLTDVISGGPPEVGRIELATTLVVRDSTARRRAD